MQTAALQRMKSELSKCDIGLDGFWIFNSVLKRSLKFESKSTIWQARRKRWWKGHIQINVNIDVHVSHRCSIIVSAACSELHIFMESCP